MKKIIGLILCLSIWYVGLSQVKSSVISEMIFNNENIFTSQKSLTAINILAWSNDFSVSADWVISNVPANGEDWIITTNAPAGTYSNSIGAINSTSAANGFALYDSDYIGSSGGTQDASIATSSAIDLTLYSNLEISFQQLYRRYQNEHCYVGISTNGSSWSNIEVNSSVSSGTTVSNTVTVDISAIADNEATVWVRFQYVGSWDYAWMVDDVEINGAVANQPEIILVNPDEAEQDETLSVSISGQYTHFTQGSETVWFEQASQTIMSGSNIVVQSSTQLSIDLAVPANAPIGMYDVKVQNPSDGIISKYNGFEVLSSSSSPGWSYTNTGSNHSILIPQFATITIDGTPVVTGDYIGVFYNDGGTFECGGYMIYDGSTNFLAAWGDDSGTPDKDGFDTGEEFVFKIWDSSSELEYNAVAVYETASFPNTGFYSPNGQSGISSLIATSQSTQTLSLAQGWGMFSTYIEPVDPSVVTVFSPVYSELIIIKNGNGQVYWPPFVDMIGNLIIGEGYQVNMSTAQTLDVTGTAVAPELTPISIQLGWSIFGYLRQTPADIVTMLSNVVSDIIIVKNASGSVYWPYWGVNGIGNLTPGQGYQINTSSTLSLVFPANSQNQKSILYFSQYTPIYYNTINPTGCNMSLAIPESSWNKIPAIGDEIGIFTSEGVLVGSTAFNGGNIALPVWGDDIYTFYTKEGMLPNEEFEIRLYQHATNRETTFTVESWIEGDGIYKTDGLSVAGKLLGNTKTALMQNIPNPCGVSTEIQFYLADDCSIKLQIFNSLGEFIEEIASGNFQEGKHSTTLNTFSYSAGNYFYTLNVGTEKLTKHFKVIK
ncbi:MAG: T9SS type A sorting domain-containing protein [Bacteroidota bacterium]|nr:T9SS type A sorting domain-containing protein [Bacteroidota bacterium]